jgi:co-chaperonin GroES (HSP10)
MIGNKVLLKELAFDNRSVIILPDGHKPEILRCEVIEAGPGYVTDKGLVPLQVKKGDHVYIPEHVAVGVEFNSFKYLICAEDRILAIWRKDV